MVDRLDVETRSRNMANIRSKNTLPEKLAYSYLNRNKIYYQKHYKRVAGSPDIAIPRKKLAVFIDGDFWHGRNYAKSLERLPDEYWRNKITANVKRDKIQMKTLTNSGWRVLRVWESDLKRKSTQSEQLEMIKKFLTE